MVRGASLTLTSFLPYCFDDDDNLHVVPRKEDF